MSYYKQFIAASAALAASTIRGFTDVPSHVKEFAACEVEKLKESPGYAVWVELTGHSPFGTAPWEQAGCKLETRWIQIMDAPSLTEEAQPERVRQAARPIARPDVEDTGAEGAAGQPADGSEDDGA